MSHRAAKQLLTARSLAPYAIIAVFPYAVVYLDRGHAVRTAWTLREKVEGGGERVKVWSEPGLPAFPTEEGS